MPYLLDANVFIEAKNRHYGFDFCPAFWSWLIDKHRQGCIYSINKVCEELRVQEDELRGWVDELDGSFFLDERESLPACLSAVSRWTTTANLPSSEPYRSDAIATFLRKADYFLVAQALDRGFAIVTHELLANTPTKIKIPNVCKGVNVRYLTPYEMLREQHARFVLPEN